MPKTNLIIHIVIEEDTAIARSGTISVSRGDIGHLRAFKTTKASDTVYAIEQAVKALVELERKEPAKPTQSTSKPPRPSLKDAPEADETEAPTTTDEEETTPASDAQPTAAATCSSTAADELNYDLIKVAGAHQSPTAYKHAVLLAEALRAEKLWDNTTPISFDNPVEAWTQHQAGTLSLQDVISLYTTAPAAPVSPSAPTTAEPLTAQPSLI